MRMLQLAQRGCDRERKLVIDNKMIFNSQNSRDGANGADDPALTGRAHDVAVQEDDSIFDMDVNLIIFQCPYKLIFPKRMENMFLKLRIRFLDWISDRGLIITPGIFIRIGYGCLCW